MNKLKTKDVNKRKKYRPGMPTEAHGSCWKRDRDIYSLRKKGNRDLLFTSICFLTKPIFSTRYMRSTFYVYGMT